MAHGTLPVDKEGHIVIGKDGRKKAFVKTEVAHH